MQQAGSQDFDQKVLKPKGSLVVVYFWGTNCPNCEVFANHLPMILEDLKGAPVEFVKVNAYETPDLAERFGLYGVPTFLLIRGGKLLGRMTTFQSREYFVTVIRETLARI